MAAQLSASVRKEVLPSGLTVITETMPHTHTVAMGVFVAAGSQDETRTQAGIAHVIEHMLFKGTRRRSAKALAEAMDAVGGRTNAYTSKEHTLFHANVPAERAEFSCDFLSDILLKSRLAADDLTLEKNVIQEEIKMGEDAADEYVHELAEQALWPGQPLGRLIIGSRQSVAALRGQHLRAFMQRYYHPANLVWAVAGAVQHQQVLAWVQKYFTARSRRKPRHRSAVLTQARPQYLFLKRDTEQANVCLAYPLSGYHSQRRAVQLVLNGILGGNMSSRLFQELREKRGLAYSVGSYPTHYRGAGALVLYGGTSPATLEKTLRLMRALAQGLADKGVSARELVRAREQLRGSTYLANESSMARMIWLGRSELQFGRHYSVQKFIDEVMQVTREQVRAEARRIFASCQPSAALIGPFEGSSPFKKVIYG